MMPTGPTEPTGHLTWSSDRGQDHRPLDAEGARASIRDTATSANMAADSPAVAAWIDQAVERALVLSDMDFLIGQAIDTWLYCTNPGQPASLLTGTEVMPRSA